MYRMINILITADEAIIISDKSLHLVSLLLILSLIFCLIAKLYTFHGEIKQTVLAGLNHDPLS